MFLLSRNDTVVPLNAAKPLLGGEKTGLQTPPDRRAGVPTVWQHSLPVKSIRGCGQSTAEDAMPSPSFTAAFCIDYAFIRAPRVVNLVRARAGCARLHGSGRVAAFTTTARGRQ